MDFKTKLYVTKNICQLFSHKVTLTLNKPTFTDTDSLMYEIKTEDIYEYFSKDKEMSDFSDYSLGQNIMMI